MAPVVSLADDVERLSVALAALARVALAGKLQLGQLAKPAAAAGLSASEAAAFMRGEVVLPSRQSVAFISAVLEQSRAQQANYMEQLRKPHSGSNSQQGSYQERMAERVKLSRNRTEDRTWLRGGPLEVTAADAKATLARLAKDFPGWRFECDGVESLATDKPKLTWLARHPDHGSVNGVTSLEVAGKCADLEEVAALDAAVQAQYRTGGIRR
jgi:hypothetical protein